MKGKGCCDKRPLLVFLLDSHYLSPLVKVLSFENEKKNKFSFCILLTYSYLSPLVKVGCISEKLK